MKDLSIIIVNYNVKHFLEQTLSSVFKALKNVDAEVFVVDNNSVDGSCEMVKAKFKQVHLIENHENYGFSRANNQAISKAQGKYILLLNPDTLVEEDTFEKCIRFMEEHSDCGALGVKMVDGSGRFLPESKRGLPTPAVAFYKIFGLAKCFPNSKIFGKYHLTYLDKEKTHQVDVLSGAFMFMRKAALDKSGLLDENFFMYGEDIDLSYRIILSDYKNYYFPETRIIHYKGESTKKSSVNYVFVFYRAMVIFAEKHFSSSNAWLFSFLINTAIYLRASMAIVSRVLKNLSWVITDIISIFGGMYFLKTYWENNHKWVKTPYPSEYMLVAVPVYIFIWLTSVYLNGGYDKPFSIFRVARGAAVGALIISAFSNFIDAFRFSKALIILGSAYTVFYITLSRYFLHFIKYGNLYVDKISDKRIALIGSYDEVNRVEKILQHGKLDEFITGHIYLDEKNNTDERHLGKVEDLSKLCEIYKLNELIFCAKDIPAHQIINWMTSIKNPDVEYKIVPDDSNFIIGSSSKETQGDYYTFNIELNINKKENRRSKRIFDISFSAFLLLFFPLLVFTHRKFKNISDAFAVLAGQKTWVGFSPDASVELPQLNKPSVFNPTTAQNIGDVNTTNRLNMLYAKDYKLSTDIEILWRNI